MRIVVCIRQGLDGEINPFDACAYEEALKIEGAEIILLSMAARSAESFLLNLTRLGARRAILLSDKAFAGADTLATAYTLSLAIKKLAPDMVFCGRQTLIGDTGQTGVMLSVLAGFNLITNVMSIESVNGERIICKTRSEGEACASFPALLTIERVNVLRRPRLRSTLGETEVWNSEQIGADISRCGLAGSPTRVIKTFENTSGMRKCKFIDMSELRRVIDEGLKKSSYIEAEKNEAKERLESVLSVGDAPVEYARSVSDNVCSIPLAPAEQIAKKIAEIKPNAVLFGSDDISKRRSAELAALLGLGLCADCTRLECEGGELIMYRPALSGSIIAKIKSLSKPAMATVRTESKNEGAVIIGIGHGAVCSIDKARALAKELGATLCASRKLVDNGYASYGMQVGLTGKTVCPPVYIAIGISGAVHHVAGMQRSGTVIAINPDKDAPIFNYADYGILESF